MQSGKLDRRITIQGKSITQSDSGQEVVVWTDVATVWAEKIPIRGLERFSIQQIVGESVKTFRIRWSSDVSEITDEHRIMSDGRAFDITDVREIGRRVGIEIDAFAPGELPMVVPEEVEIAFLLLRNDIDNLLLRNGTDKLLLGN